MATLDEWACRQLGLITITQLRLLGWTTKAIVHAVACHRLIPVRPGVYRLPGAKPTREQAWLAAVLAAPERTVLANTTGAVHWGFKGFETDGLDLLRQGRGRVRLAGVTDHRTLWLPDRDITRWKSIPVTTPERTLIDACGAVPFDALKKAATDAMRRRLIMVPKLVRTFRAVPVSGRRASKPMKELLAYLDPTFDPGDSDCELDVMEILKRAGVPLPTQQFKVVVEGHTYRLDFSYPPAMEAMEWDSFTFHGMDAYAFHYDRQRTRRLQRAGWKIWPLTSETTAEEVIDIAAGAAARAGAG